MNAPAIDVRGLTVSFPEKVAVSDLSFAVAPGEIFGLLGPNGAGKSTTIDCLAGLRSPDAGRVRVLGLDPVRDRARVTRRLAVQPQSASLLTRLTVAETVTLFASFHAAPLNPAAVMERTGLTECRDRRVGALSGGEERRLLLAAALVGDPEVLVLDEPSAGLDPAARHAVAEIILGLRDSGRAVLLSTHHMDEADALCDRVGILVGGSLVALDTPAELARSRQAESRVAFTIARDVGPGLLDQLSALGALSHETGPSGHRVTITTADPDTAVRRITFVPGLAARDIDVHRGSLEDFFLSVAGHHSTEENR